MLNLNYEGPELKTSRTEATGFYGTVNETYYHNNSFIY